MHEDLLGYLLGALSAEEQRRVEDALAAHPHLRAELERIRRSLQPLDALNDEMDPPAGLAERTVASIDETIETLRPTPLSLRSPGDAPRGFHPLCDKATTPRHLCHVSDGIVLALVGLSAITMLLPALANSRFESRRDACQNNLRQVGTLLIGDSLAQGGRFLQVPDAGNRAFDGVFASLLVDRQLLATNTTALLCPGVSWRSEYASWRVPTLREIDAAQGPELERLRGMAGGNYSYAVGYLDGAHRYRPIVNEGRSHFPILADAPSLHLEYSANHSGRGQNFMYEDGHIAFVTRLQDLSGDDPWRNHQGYAEAGQGQNDAVLLRSESPPFATPR